MKSKWKSIMGTSNIYVRICLRSKFYVGMFMWEVFMRKSMWGVYGAKYLVFVSSCSLKTRELSFAQFVYFFREVCLFFNF